jgi:hypothetical protein
MPKYAIAELGYADDAIEVEQLNLRMSLPCFIAFNYHVIHQPQFKLKTGSPSILRSCVFYNFLVLKLARAFASQTPKATIPCLVVDGKVYDNTKVCRPILNGAVDLY